MGSVCCRSIEDVQRIVKEKNISFIQFWFTDVLGFLKSFAVTPSELEEGMVEGMGFDGSSIEGFARIQESDMIAKPDPTTFQLVPWRSGDRPVARMFCDILNPDGTPYDGDPRYVLKRLLKKVSKRATPSTWVPSWSISISRTTARPRSWTLAGTLMPGRWMWEAT